MTSPNRAQTWLQPNGAARQRGTLLAQLGLILAVSVAYEALFLHHGIAWLFDEGWPLYAAMQLHAGGTLYQDVFFLFPPGHLLPAWIAYQLDPPGIFLARSLYSAFSVALCLAIYLLGRQLMQPRFALLAALLVAVAAPRAHLAHLLFGYRYLIFSVLALLAFSVRLRTGDRRWMAIAGVCAGLALVFRITPAFAVSCGIGIAIMSIDRRWQSWPREWAAYMVGMMLIAAPVIAWFASQAGLEAVWSQAVLRILPLQEAQSKPVPALGLPLEWTRAGIHRWFVAMQFWTYPLLYVGYAAMLGRAWRRALRTGEVFAQPLLLATTIWGAIFFLRTLGRSDEAHLASALPPACLLVAHLCGTLDARLRARLTRADRGPQPGLELARTSALLLVLASWIFLQGSDLYLSRSARGQYAVRAVEPPLFIRDRDKARLLDRTASRIARSTRPDERVLDLSNAPLLHVITGRHGPGYGDVVTPGVFADPDDERAFVARLDRAPPALVLWPRQPFDRMASRSLQITAPQLSRWVAEHYELEPPVEWVQILVPRRPLEGSRSRSPEEAAR